MPRIYLSPPHVTGREAELVADAIASNWIAPLGPHVDAFEAELAAVAGVEHAVALSSGTAALHLALVVLGIGAGDEVACSGFTFAASANAVTYSGATPFFVDATAETWTIDPDLLDRAIGSRRDAGATVRAVVAVDLYGQCCDYDALLEVCARHDVVLVQDAAESLGATYRGAPAGGQGALADEVFMTGTAAEVSPVRAVDDVELGVGPVTLELQTAYLDAVNGRAEQWNHWLDVVEVRESATA